MHRLLFVALATSIACDPKDSSLGDLPDAETGNETAAEGASDSGGSRLPVGAPCSPSIVPEAHLLDLGNAGCPSGMCIYADAITATPHATCSDDDDCVGHGEGVICTDEGRCALDPEHVAARSMCTEFCEVDADCVGVEGTSCAGGFVCSAFASLGPACCDKVCVCVDDFSVEFEDVQTACDQGAQPGCCDQDPPAPACGG